MNFLGIAVLNLLILTGVFAPCAVYADEISDAVAYHENLAATYKGRAGVEEASIAEHQQMKKDYQKKFSVIPKFETPNRVKEMNKHCDTIIRETDKLKHEFLKFAEWHRMRAAELKGQ